MSKISVILLEDIAEVGKAGTVATVSEGYARNFLFPQGKAALADDAASRRIEQQEQHAQQADAARLAQLQEVAASLTGTELVITARVKEGDEIYGTIPAARIAKDLNAQAGLQLKARDVLVPEPIKKLGTHDVVIKLDRDVETELKVVVVGDAPPTDSNEA